MKIYKRYLAATNMIHHACYRWNEEEKQKSGQKNQNATMSKRDSVNTSTFSLRGDDIHVNDV